VMEEMQEIPGIEAVKSERYRNLQYLFISVCLIRKDRILKGIPDPDPTLQVFLNPGQRLKIQLFYQVKGQKFLKSFISV